MNLIILYDKRRVMKIHPYFYAHAAVSSRFSFSNCFILLVSECTTGTKDAWIKKENDWSMMSSEQNINSQKLAQTPQQLPARLIPGDSPRENNTLKNC